jgi:hypothetical protein
VLRLDKVKTKRRLVMDTQMVIRCKDATPDDVRSIMLKAGSKIGSVWFCKRSDGSLRKMCYRLGVSNPSHASQVKRDRCKYCGRHNCATIRAKHQRKQADMRDKGLMTVFDVNKVVRDKDGNVVYKDGHMCRGAWRTVPLDGVTRVCAGGTVYEIEQ